MQTWIHKRCSCLQTYLVLSTMLKISIHVGFATAAKIIVIIGTAMHKHKIILELLACLRYMYQIGSHDTKPSVHVHRPSAVNLILIFWHSQVEIWNSLRVSLSVTARGLWTWTVGLLVPTVIYIHFKNYRFILLNIYFYSITINSSNRYL